MTTGYSMPVTVSFTPRILAEVFAEMGDEDQAQFFIEVAEIAKTWEDVTFRQWYSVGAHLRTCKCSTDDARELVRSLAAGVGVDCNV